MAQTKRKRRTKHRGTPAGTIQTRGRTGRRPTAEERKNQSKTAAREKRLNTPPTWKASAIRAGVIAVGLFVILTLLGRGSHRVESAAILAVISLALYIPGGYYIESIMYRRRLAKREQGGRK
ncbi:MAG: hypothetical protein ACLQA5_22725 [Solirubrobacteraceae bacterium]